MNNLEHLGFNNWFWESISSGKYKVDLSIYATVRLQQTLESTTYSGIESIKKHYGNDYRKRN